MNCYEKGELGVAMVIEQCKHFNLKVHKMHTACAFDLVIEDYRVEVKNSVRKPKYCGWWATIGRSGTGIPDHRVDYYIICLGEADGSVRFFMVKSPMGQAHFYVNRDQLTDKFSSQINAWHLFAKRKPNPPVYRPCVGCGTPLNATQRLKTCACGARPKEQKR